MTLDEMISWIADRDHLHEGPKIMAALKAGQVLRDEVDYYYDNDTPGCKAWDAAIKGEI